jgi:flagellar basal-body rod protein FlgG
MFTGLYASSAGMLAQMRNMDIISNNIANINTSGFKKDKSIFRTFYDDAINSENSPLTAIGTVLRNKDLNSMPVIERTSVNFTDGVIKHTDNMLDVAIQGDGFFELQGPNDETYYTRSGKFELNENREIVTLKGFKLMGEIAAIRIPETEIENLSANLIIDKEGNVSLGEDTLIDKLSIFRFVDNNNLDKVGHNLFVNRYNNNISDEFFNGRVYQHSLEISNVNPVEEMSEMIVSNRAFEAYQKVIRAIMDDTADKSINMIGRIR